jgi:hypothetical protein
MFADLASILASKFSLKGALSNENISRFFFSISPLQAEQITIK